MFAVPFSTYAEPMISLFIDNVAMPNSVSALTVSDVIPVSSADGTAETSILLGASVLSIIDGSPKRIHVLCVSSPDTSLNISKIYILPLHEAPESVCL